MKRDYSFFLEHEVKVEQSALEYYVLICCQFYLAFILQRCKIEKLLLKIPGKNLSKDWC